MSAFDARMKRIAEQLEEIETRQEAVEKPEILCFPDWPDYWAAQRAGEVPYGTKVLVGMSLDDL